MVIDIFLCYVVSVRWDIKEFFGVNFVVGVKVYDNWVIVILCLCEGYGCWIYGLFEFLVLYWVFVDGDVVVEGVVYVREYFVVFEKGCYDFDGVVFVVGYFFFYYFGVCFLDVDYWVE